MFTSVFGISIKYETLYNAYSDRRICNTSGTEKANYKNTAD